MLNKGCCHTQARSPIPISLIGPLGIALAQTGGSAVLGGLTQKHGTSKSDKTRNVIATSPFDAQVTQNFLPPSLRLSNTGAFMNAGVQGIGELIRNPGGLSPTISDAVRGRLAGQSENIAQSFRGIGQNQAGAAARGNLPVSIKAALDSALKVAQDRAQRGATREAFQDSDALRRQDLAQIFPLLDAMLQFSASGKGQAITGLGQSAQLAGQRDATNAASNQAMIGSILNSISNIPPAQAPPQQNNPFADFESDPF